MTNAGVTKPPQDIVVVVEYSDLLKDSSHEQRLTEEDSLLGRQIEQAYGPDGLGLLTVAGVPGFVELRQRLLPLAQAFAALPDPIKSLYADPTSLYNFGWSHGVEQLASGQPDRHKGSYYANPLIDVPTTDEALMKQFPAYCRPNIWPTEHLPEFQPAFQELGRLICQVGMLVTNACDKYVAARNSSFPKGRLLQSIQSSSCHKGRLLHYFPPEPVKPSGSNHATSHHQNSNASMNGAAPAAATVNGSHANGNSNVNSSDTSNGISKVSSSDTSNDLNNSINNVGSSVNSTDKSHGASNGISNGVTEKEEDWCGWHTDHGSLTGLTSAMYMRGDEAVPNPDPQAGLYVRARQGGQITQAPIPFDHIAFQMGEAMQVMSGGLLRATPHYVRAPRKDRTQGVSRNTLAIFMQPRWDEVMDLPEGGLPQSQVGVGHWQPGISFGQFAEHTVKGFYHAKT